MQRESQTLLFVISTYGSLANSIRNSIVMANFAKINHLTTDGSFAKYYFMSSKIMPAIKLKNMRVALLLPKNQLLKRPWAFRS